MAQSLSSGQEQLRIWERIFISCIFLYLMGILTPVFLTVWRGIHLGVNTGPADPHTLCSLAGVAALFCLAVTACTFVHPSRFYLIVSLTSSVLFALLAVLTYPYFYPQGAAITLLMWLSPSCLMALLALWRMAYRASFHESRLPFRRSSR